MAKPSGPQGKRSEFRNSQGFFDHVRFLLGAVPNATDFRVCVCLVEVLRPRFGKQICGLPEPSYITKRDLGRAYNILDPGMQRLVFGVSLAAFISQSKSMFLRLSAITRMLGPLIAF